MMKTFHDKIDPIAIELVTKLTEDYCKLVEKEFKEGSGWEKESDPTLNLRELKATRCFAAVKRIIIAVRGNKELLIKISKLIFSCVLLSLSISSLDCREDSI